MDFYNKYVLMDGMQPVEQVEMFIEVEKQKAKNELESALQASREGYQKEQEEQQNIEKALSESIASSQKIKILTNLDNCTNLSQGQHTDKITCELFDFSNRFYSRLESHRSHFCDNFTLKDIYDDYKKIDSNEMNHDEILNKYKIVFDMLDMDIQKLLEDGISKAWTLGHIERHLFANQYISPRPQTGSFKDGIINARYCNNLILSFDELSFYHKNGYIIVYFFDKLSETSRMNKFMDIYEDNQVPNVHIGNIENLNAILQSEDHQEIINENGIRTPLDLIIYCYFNCNYRHVCYMWVKVLKTI